MVAHPLPIISDTYLCAISYQIGTVPFANVLCVSKPASNAALVGAAFENCWFATNSFNKLTSQTMTYKTIRTTPLDGTGLADIRDITARTGGIVNTPVAANVCGIFTFRTGQRGRSYRGRMYLGAIQSVYLNTTGSQWTSAYITAANTAITAWQGALVTNGLTHEVLSRHLGVATPVLQIVPRQYIGSQRDRTESQM